MRQILVEMNIQAEKIKLIEWLVGIKDEALLQQISRFRKDSVKAEYELDLSPMSVEELEERAMKSEAAIQEGDVTSFADFKEEIKSW